MRVQMDNRGVHGKQSYLMSNPPGDSLGLEYPIGARVEHLYGSGIWVGGMLDTATFGTSPPLRLVSMSGPWIHEFYPGSSPADTIWKVFGRNASEPLGWSDYWGSALPFAPISDNDNHCVFADDNRYVSHHIPLHLKVIQSSFVWNHPYADGIHIIQYRIMNRGVRTIDSAYFGFAAEADVGPVSVPNYWMRNYAGYYRSLHTAYVHNPVDSGSTPFGLALLNAPRPLDSLRITFLWYWGDPPISANSDVWYYQRMSSGVIYPDEYPQFSDTRALLACGPFRIRPSTDPNPDTLCFAVALLSAPGLAQLQTRAQRAISLYEEPPDFSPPDLPTGFELSQNFPNPLNLGTEIRFAVPEASSVSLKVYDVLGREVRTLVDDQRTASTYHIRWDGSDNEGNTVASGVYFYRMVASGWSNSTFTNTKKLMLLK
jgi:hypothetical protein